MSNRELWDVSQKAQPRPWVHACPANEALNPAGKKNITGWSVKPHPNVTNACYPHLIFIWHWCLCNCWHQIRTVSQPSVTSDRDRMQATPVTNVWVHLVIGESQHLTPAWFVSLTATVRSHPCWFLWICSSLPYSITFIFCCRWMIQ